MAGKPKLIPKKQDKPPKAQKITKLPIGPKRRPGRPAKSATEVTKTTSMESVAISTEALKKLNEEMAVMEQQFQEQKSQEKLIQDKIERNRAEALRRQEELRIARTARITDKDLQDPLNSSDAVNEIVVDDVGNQQGATIENVNEHSDTDRSTLQVSDDTLSEHHVTNGGSSDQNDLSPVHVNDDAENVSFSIKRKASGQNGSKKKKIREKSQHAVSKSADMVNETENDGQTVNQGGIVVKKSGETKRKTNFEGGSPQKAKKKHESTTWRIPQRKPIGETGRRPHSPPRSIQSPSPSEWYIPAPPRNGLIMYDYLKTLRSNLNKLPRYISYAEETLERMPRRHQREIDSCYGPIQDIKKILNLK